MIRSISPKLGSITESFIYSISNLGLYEGDYVLLYTHFFLDPNEYYYLNSTLHSPDSTRLP